jgi:hypothetical protein
MPIAANENQNDERARDNSRNVGPQESFKFFQKYKKVPFAWTNFIIKNELQDVFCLFLLDYINLTVALILIFILKWKQLFVCWGNTAAPASVRQSQIYFKQENFEGEFQ